LSQVMSGKFRKDQVRSG